MIIFSKLLLTNLHKHINMLNIEIMYKIHNYIYVEGVTSCYFDRIRVVTTDLNPGFGNLKSLVRLYN